MERDKDYINNLNLEFSTQKDVKILFEEFEKGNLSKDEYIALSFLAHSVSYSKGYQSCFNYRRERDKNKPRVMERFADNGEHSHWECVDADGNVLIKFLNKKEN